MAPSLDIYQSPRPPYESLGERSPKRRRLSQQSTEDADGRFEEPGIPSHPNRVKPLGNSYDTDSTNLKTSAGGFALLPDELLLQVLEHLGPSALQSLGSTCKALHAFCLAEELWKGLFVARPPPSFTWRGSWRSTLLGMSKSATIDCTGLFSDVLYRPFFCAHVPLTRYVTKIPTRNEIDRLEDLTVEKFTAEWASKPFILTKPVGEWPVYQSWSTPALLKKYRDTKFRAEAVDWPLSTYVSYMEDSSDESPLYLFDCKFAEKMNLKVTSSPEPDADYWPPTCFGPDLFDVLDDQRPDRRWLIVGPARSGSTFHKDPNATSAWNAVIRGSKYWIMFPSSPSTPPPPGVYVSEDQSEVTSPLSIAEWLLGFHEEARRTPGCKEGICREGEVLYVPSGWYHLVLNLEDSIALTQNFIPQAHLGAALEFLRDRKDQVSGFDNTIKDPYALFMEKMESRHPALLRAGLATLEQMTQTKKSAWETLTAPDDQPSSFSFGFGGPDDDYDGDEDDYDETQA